MKIQTLLTIAAGAAAVLAVPAHAVDAAAAKALAQQKACTACHAVERKMVGPAYKAVAEKYKGMKPEELAASIQKGGAGKWGPVPMPAQKVSDSEAKLLAEWILAGAPDK